MNKVLFKDTLRTVGRTSSRFFSIVIIVALGISFFAGMNATAPDMHDGIRDYYAASNASDIRITSTVGLTAEDLALISSIRGVKGVCGEKFVDGVVTVDGKKITDLDGSRMSVRAYAVDVNKAVENYTNSVNDPNYINRPMLIEGSWPTSENQCLIDESSLSTPEEFKIGSQIELEGDGTDLTSSLSQTTYTVCGIIRTPLYISYQRGNTNIGTGKLGSFIYVPQDVFTADYYSGASVIIDGADKLDPYSEQYEQFIQPYISYIESISAERVAPRAESLKAEYTDKVNEGEEQYAKTKIRVDKEIANGQAKVDEILDMAENGDEKLEEYKRQYNEKATEAQNTIGDSKVEHSTQYAKWEEKRQEYNEAKALVEKYATAETDYKNAITQYNVANTTVETSLTTVETLESLVATTRAAVDQLNSDQSTSAGDIISRFEKSGVVGEEVDNIIANVKSFTAVGTAEEISAYMEPQLQTFELQLSSAKSKLSSAKTSLAEKKIELDEAEQLVEKLKEVKAQLSVSEIELEAAEKELTDAGYSIQFGELEVISRLSDLKNQITSYETAVSLAKEKKDTAQADYEKAKTEAYAKLDSAKNQLETAKNFLISLDSAKWYVNGRENSLMGYKEYGQTIDRTKALALVFPWFFFLVAALVSLNTMTRMVDDERTQLGTLKAMGLHDNEIIVKYVFYAFIASFIGAISGSFLGFAIFPTVITACYGILYDVPPIAVDYRIGYAAIGILLSVGFTVGATYIAAVRSLKTHPSILMKPKAPRGGKKILLEKLPAVWSRLSFKSKISLRNVMRSKKRFIMAVVGVMGCTALLVAGFGLNNSLHATIDNQFIKEDRINDYDMQIVLNGSYDTTVTECDAANVVSQRPEVSMSMLEYMKTFDTSSDKSDKVMETYVFVPEDSSALSNYIHIRDKDSKQEIQLAQNGCIITQKLAKKLNLSIGDSIKVETDEGVFVTVPVAGIAENYTFHYVYMTKEVYAACFGASPSYNYIAANFSGELSDEQKVALSQDLLGEYEISAVSYSEDIQSMFKNTLDSIGYVVIVLIVSAALLCIIVLYNLSVININERTKEIATIKVLGFTRNETNSYIFRENIMLAVIGTALGLFLGKWVHRLVIALSEVDIIMYGRQVGFKGYVLAAVLSIVFSLFVNLILINKIKQVDMVTSLKSNE